MADRLDELLRRLPAETMPADLPARIQLDLQAQRTREKRIRWLSDAALVGLAVIGLLALRPEVTGAAAVPSL